MGENKKRTIIGNLGDIQKKWEESGFIEQSSKDSNFDIFPIVKQVFAQTVSQNLAPIQPMGGLIDTKKIEKIKNRILSENRDKSIDSVIDGSKYIESKIEDDEEYKKVLKERVSYGELFYMDYKYGL